MAWLRGLRARVGSRLGVLAFLLAGWLATGVALAQEEAAGSPDMVDRGLDRILLALGLLVVLAQATERLMLVLRKVWAAAKQWDPGRPYQQEAERAACLDAWSIVPGLVVAFVCGIDIFEVASTGAVSSAWREGWVWVTTWWPHWPGVLVAGFIASMGSKFLGDLIALVQALKEVKQYKAEEARRGRGVVTAEQREDVRTLLESDAESIYDVERPPLGLSLNELSVRAPLVRAQLQEQGIEGIVGVGPGYKERGERGTRVRGLTVSVVEKYESPEREIPAYIETMYGGEKVLVPLDVEEVGDPEPAGILRPGAVVDGGTACCLVECRQNHAPLLLGCRHILGRTGAQFECAGVSGEVARSSRAYDASIGTINGTVPSPPNETAAGIRPVGTLGLMPDEVSNAQPRYVSVFGREGGGNEHVAGGIVGIRYVVPVLGLDDLAVALLTNISVRKGDSGALAVAYDEGGPKAVGMLCARSTTKQRAWFVPLSVVFMRLGVSLLR